MNNPTVPHESASHRRPFQLRLVLLLCAHIAAACVSLIYAAGLFPDVVTFDKAHIFAAMLTVLPFALVSVLFVLGRFSFGYLAGFYLYTMILGYLWLVHFSLLPYNHRLATISIFLSALAFLTPALLITSPIRQRICLSSQAFDRLSSLILVFTAIVVAAGALYNFKLASLSEMYKFRAELEFPVPLRYAIGMTSNALLPFAFACFVVRKRLWLAGFALLLFLIFYPVTLTRLTLFAPFWLLFLVLLLNLTEARMAVILSLFLPISAGLGALLLTGTDVFPFKLGMQYFGTVNGRVIAMPSIALEVYNNFFSNHDLTHFCQINLLKLVVGCSYNEPLSVIMSKVYQLGAFNASLFATEGIASVGLVMAPISALGCGLVIALANRLSWGLPPRFVVLSGAMLPLVLLNVPLSTTLLTNGAAVLFLLWYITPRASLEGRKVS